MYYSILQGSDSLVCMYVPIHTKKFLNERGNIKIVGVIETAFAVYCNAVCNALLEILPSTFTRVSHQINAQALWSFHCDLQATALMKIVKHL